MAHKYTILSTALLPDSATKRLQETGINCVQHPYIRTESAISTESSIAISNLATQQKTVLFTSAKAVQSVIEQLEFQKPDWQFYCISGKTKEAVIAHWAEERIIAVGDDALALLKSFDKIAPKEIVFFCGNKRLDTLPKGLAKKGFKVSEYQVYKTQLTPKKQVKQFDAILFFSPSGIESFLLQNTIPPTATLFAIGNTTAKHLSNFCANQIIVSPSPDKNILVNTLIEFYKNKAI